MINWKVLDNVPLLLYILALKTLVLCLAFAGAKIYQSKKAEAALKQEMEMKRKLALQTQELIDDKKDD
ncbi:small integral membrane protein 11A-like [Cyprinus carpio]|uniref:Small integral membrane protein 11A-like n=1 Tax=Cyprinus carpio TaxID=7962 RepID=A0A8C1R704_CYPCA|nr:small integral membrane protein 11A-like [Cyprinus carpio]XP_042573030.1 small integral membrane protein 11A-like [Cyprinus carpio]